MSDPLLESIQPEGWARPRGYVNGMITRGPLLHVAGQIGWEPDTCTFEALDMISQFGRALDNVLDVVRAAGGGPESVARMTVYVTDMDAYRTAGRALGDAWKARFGRHYPSMALVRVVELVEPRALIEIEAVACLAPSSPTQPNGEA
ncbi:MAG: enamine deaminase RidA (YjgF/YER057c/UK114 family) [Myxococcota bacterium]|jgi:enamine deaminase RidA (YjgF/YER057c/UK114 family)